MRFADRVTGASHVEEQVAVFKQGCRRMFGQVGLQAFGKLVGETVSEGPGVAMIDAAFTSLAVRAGW